MPGEQFHPAESQKIKEAHCASAEASLRMMPSNQEMAGYFHCYATAAGNDLPGELVFNDPFKSPVKLFGHISNAPDVSRGVQTWQDVQDLAGRTYHGIVDEPIRYLSQPSAVSDSLIQLGPVLDTAVNYYGEKMAAGDSKGFVQDINRFDQGVWKEAVDALDRLSYPMDQRQIGRDVAAASPYFFVGAKKPFLDETVKQLQLDLKSDAELLEYGIVRSESTVLKADSNNGFMYEKSAEVKDLAAKCLASTRIVFSDN